MLRRLLPLLICLAGFHRPFATAAPASTADYAFVHVWPGWREASSFERLSEYFGGQESTGRESIHRTQPTARAGYYFLVRVKNAGALAGARFELRVIDQDHPEPQLHLFPINLTRGEQVHQLGLTGTDWPRGRTAHPVAWQLTLHAADGHILATQKSFLWEKPAK